MKKLYIAILSTTLCIQQAQGMEQLQITTTITQAEYSRILSTSGNFNTTDRFINVQSRRFKDNYSFILTQTVDLLSLKLYNNNLNENEIEELVKQGANINYKDPEHLYYNCTIASFHAANKTEQGIKNMQKLIALGANLHYSHIQDSTPLNIAVQHNIIPMITLLLPYEKIETPTYLEQQARKALISYSISNNNVDIVKMLLQLKLMNPNKGLKELIRLNKSNEEMVHCLIDSGANNQGDYLNKVADKAFSDKSIQLLNLLTNNGAFDKNVLTKMRTIKELLDSTIDNLEKNQTQ